MLIVIVKLTTFSFMEKLTGRTFVLES